MWELHQRLRRCQRPGRVQGLHGAVVNDVRAQAQAAALERLEPLLEGQELEWVRRGRNRAGQGPRKGKPESMAGRRDLRQWWAGSFCRTRTGWLSCWIDWIRPTLSPSPVSAMSPRFIRRDKGSGAGSAAEGPRGAKPSRLGSSRFAVPRSGAAFRGPRPEWRDDGERGGGSEAEHAVMSAAANAAARVVGMDPGRRGPL